MWSNLVHGLTGLTNLDGMTYLVAGSLIGVFLGVVPGLGGSVILSIVLAFINHISIEGTLSLFLAVQAGSYFSASVTSILLNTPAHPEAFAVTFDGFPMAQRGEAGRALGISAASTCIGGLIGCAVLVGFIQIVNYLPLIFHPPEYVALIVIAMLLVGTLGTDAISKAIASAGLGLMVASIGTSGVTGAQRFIFNAVSLQGGISLVALVLGLFAIPQMTLVFGTASTIARQDMTGREVAAAVPVALSRGVAKQIVGGILETFRHSLALVRAALIGVVTGIIPGVGGFAANFLSYGVAQQMSRRRSEFGTGIPEGIIAPEGSSLSKEAGGLVPLIALGIPGGVGAALFLAALTIKGIRLGVGFTKAYPTLPYEMMWVIALGGLIGTAAGVLAAPGLARVTRVPGPCLVPFIMAMTAIGVFVSQVEFFALVETAIFAVLGLLLRRLRYSVAAFAVGLVLGPTLEDNIYLTHTLFPGMSFVSARPLADVLFVVALAVVVLKTLQLRRDATAVRRALAAPAEAGEEAAAASVVAPYPLLSLLMSAGIVAFCIAFIVYGVEEYDFSTVLMPAAAAAAAAAAALVRLPFDVSHYLLARRRRGGTPPGGALSTDGGPAQPVVVRESERSLALIAAAGGAAAPGAARLLVDAADEAIVPSAPSVGAAARLPAIEEKRWGRHGQYTREVVALGWFGFLIAACYLFGFDIGVPAFCTLYGLLATRRVFARLTGRLLFAAGTAAVMWGAAFGMIGVLHISVVPVVRL